MGVETMKSSPLLLLACAVGVSAYTCNVYTSSVWSNTSASFPSVAQSTCGYGNDQCVTYGYSVTVSLFGISATSQAVLGACAATSGNGTGYCSTLQSNLGSSLDNWFCNVCNGTASSNCNEVGYSGTTSSVGRSAAVSMGAAALVVLGMRLQ